MKLVHSAFVAAFALLAVAAWLAHRSQVRLVESAAWSQHAVSVIADLRGLLGDISDAGTAAHGFALSGDERFLGPFTRAQSEAPVLLRRLITLTADNASQQPGLAALEPLVSAELAWLEEVIALRRSDGLQAAARRVAGSWGKALLDEIRARIAELEAAEQRLLEQRQGALQARAAEATRVQLEAAGVSAALMAFAYLALLREVRERREAEAESQAARSRVQAIIDNMPAVAFVKDIEGRYTMVNRHWQSLFGHGEEEVRGVTAHELFPEPTARAMAASDRRVFDTGAPVETEQPVPRGDELRVHASIKFPLRDATGRIYAVCGIATDVTERRRAEEEKRMVAEELARQRATLQSILDSVGDGVVVADENGRFILFNPAAEAILGMSAVDAGPEQWADRYGLFRDDGVTPLPANEAPLVRAIAGESVDDDVLMVRNPAVPRGVFIRVNARPLRDADGRTSGGVAAFHDITEQRRGELELRAAKERSESATRELEAFSYSVSHDLRAPLRSIDGFSQALLEDHTANLGPEGQDCLRRVRAAAQRMGQLIDDLLRLSRITREELVRERVDLSALTAEIAERLRAVEPDRSAAFEIEAGLNAEADPRLVRIALENLLGNAWKFTRGTADARIAFVFEAADGVPGYVVRDNGAGFDMAYAGKLFSPFQRLHSPRQFDGTGIGLAIVARVVQRHGGRIWAEAAEGRGAKFTFTLSAPPGTPEEVE